MAAVLPSLGIVRVSLEDLWKLSKSQCNHMLQLHHGTAAAPMTVRTLSFMTVLMMGLACTIYLSAFLRMLCGPHQILTRLEPVVRFFLRITFFLVVPVLTSVFSLTKAEGGTGFLLALLWLLLVELIRMKVTAMAQPADGSSFSRSSGKGFFELAMGSADEVGHMVWAGYLVFFNVHGNGRPGTGSEAQKHLVPLFALLWLISFVKLVLRIIGKWLDGRSWHTGRNPLLIAAYMQHVVVAAAASSPQPMESCQFVVQGEKRLLYQDKKTAGAEPPPVTTTAGHDGNGDPMKQQHVVNLYLDYTKKSRLVTVGKVWEWGKQQGDDDDIVRRRLFSGDTRRGSLLQDLCLSISLVKLLRRRFEQYPMVEVGSETVRSVMLRGLLDLKFEGGNGPYRSTPADRPFRVLLLELDALQYYYQAVDRAVMSNLYIFFSKYLLSNTFALVYLIAILVILLTTKDAGYFYCMAVVSSGLHENSPSLVLSITLVLLITFGYFEISEFFTSYCNLWNLGRLLCYYFNHSPTTTNDHRPINKVMIGRTLLVYLFQVRYLMHSMISRLPCCRQPYIDVPIKQVSIVDACGPPILGNLLSPSPSVYLATKAKEDIIQAMKLIGMLETTTLTISLPPPLAGAAAAAASGHPPRSCTETILASHLATELFLIMHPHTPDDYRRLASAREVATTLSRYCMYLVAHMPRLLPDDEVWVSGRYKSMSACLRNVLCCCMSCMPQPRRCCINNDTLLLLDSLKKRADQDRLDDITTRDAVKLFENMEKMEKMEGWDQLASFWVRLVIYLAPSNDVQGHAQALATSGADLISCLWAFCTHTGITREERPEPEQGSHHV
ncbi:hypothetical protein BS78_05G011200 [Paspalum vaginatum]|nr:hypothetical protein BS78_05G011200 [Paspalum vaginatum]